MIPAKAPSGIAPLLRQQMAEYAATGLPPAYLTHDTSVTNGIVDTIGSNNVDDIDDEELAT